MGRVFSKDKKDVPGGSRITEQDQAILVKSLPTRLNARSLFNHSPFSFSYSETKEAEGWVEKVPEEDQCRPRERSITGQEATEGREKRVSSYIYFFILSGEWKYEKIYVNLFNVCYSRAKLLLRKKRFQEGLLEKTDGQLDNLERLVHDLEFAQVEKQVLNAGPNLPRKHSVR